jgi:hypothetical protein
MMFGVQDDFTRNLAPASTFVFATQGAKSGWPTTKLSGHSTIAILKMKSKL